MFLVSSLKPAASLVKVAMALSLLVCYYTIRTEPLRSKAILEERNAEINNQNLHYGSAKKFICI
jgi:hypothetical protein